MLHLAILHQKPLSHFPTHLCCYYNKLTQGQYLQTFNIKVKNEVRRKVENKSSLVETLED